MGQIMDIYVQLCLTHYGHVHYIGNISLYIAQVIIETFLPRNAAVTALQVCCVKNIQKNSNDSKYLIIILCSESRGQRFSTEHTDSVITFFQVILKLG